MLFWRRRMKRNDELNSRQLIVFFLFSLNRKRKKKFLMKNLQSVIRKKNVWSSTLEKIGQWTVLSVEKEEKNIKSPKGVKNHGTICLPSSYIPSRSLLPTIFLDLAIQCYTYISLFPRASTREAAQPNASSVISRPRTCLPFGTIYNRLSVPFKLSL